MPPGAELPWRGWHALRFDRQYGAMGGESPIMFVAIDAYARRYRIRGAAFETFHALVGAMDEEYLEHVQRKADDARTADEERRRVAGRGPNHDEAVP